MLIQEVIDERDVIKTRQLLSTATRLEIVIMIWTENLDQLDRKRSVRNIMGVMGEAVLVVARGIHR